MKALLTLIKLHKRKVDEMRRELGILLDAERQILEHRDRFEAQVLEEQKTAKADPTAAITYGSYVPLIKKRRENIKHSMTEIQGKIEMMRAGIAEAFNELKKFEILRDVKEKEMLAKEAAREQQMYDELGLQNFSRKEAE